MVSEMHAAKCKRHRYNVRHLMATGIALARPLEAEGIGAAACGNTAQQLFAATLDVAGGVAIYAGPHAPFT
jgi:hypothetical protein